MPYLLNPDQFLKQAAKIPVIDVRSPAEFRQGHIHGAFNVPLFNDDERARVGTTYVKTGCVEAKNLGYTIVEPKFDSFLKAASEIAPAKQLLIHCWRGGMRSESLAGFYTENGYKAGLLRGGYKAYRHYIRQEFSRPCNTILLGGMTGCGKTEILGALASMNRQVIDLEALACHKGSSFGHLGLEGQPTTEQFENDLYALWDAIDDKEPVWIEHESNSIGAVFLPDTFYAKMNGSNMLRINLPFKIRVRRIVAEYASFPAAQLEDALLRIRLRMGTLAFREAVSALGIKDFEKVAEITLEYYDKLYALGLERHPVKNVVDIQLQGDDPEINAAIVLETAQTNKLI